jgi:hypothetical protein
MSTNADSPRTLSRTTFDCARVPGKKRCSLQMTGEKKDVLAAAKQHLVSAHGHEAGAQLNKNVSKVLDDHEQTTPYSTWRG